MDRDAVLSLWEAHKEERWPQVGSQHEGPLMTLDTVISGCVVYFLDSPEGLDAQRLAIVEDCVADLDNLTDELEEDCRPYFQRLRHLGALLITTHHISSRMLEKVRQLKGSRFGSGYKDYLAQPVPRSVQPSPLRSLRPCLGQGASWAKRLSWQTQGGRVK